MNHAPDSIQYAYAKMIDLVFVVIRSGAITDKQQLHELGDALHNVSGILANYGSWIEDEAYRAIYIRPYDAKWGSKGVNLEAALEHYTEQYKEKQKTT